MKNVSFGDYDLDIVSEDQVSSSKSSCPQKSEYELEIERKIKKGVKIGIFSLIGLILLICICNCFYKVDEQENAIVYNFDEILRVDNAGFYFKLPWQKVTKVDMTTHGTGIGYTVSEDGQNITDTDNGIMITSDFNLLNIDFYLEYRVSDPIAYKHNSSDPEGIMINIARSNIRTIVSNYTVDEAMTTGKGQIQADIKEAMIKDLVDRNIGLTVVNITVQDSEPPTDEIKQAFKSVENAKQGADTAMNNANQYKNRQIPDATANADAIIQSAEAEKNARIAEANGQVERFIKLYEEYEKFPEVTKRRLFYEKMEEILPNVRIIITDGETQELFPIDSFSNTTNTTVNNTTTTTTTTEEGA